jgi:lysine 2,3-aminomutase
VLDTPHGKVPLNRSYVKGRAGPYVLMETYDGSLWAEPNPLPDGADVPVTLPAVDLPDGVDTIPIQDDDRSQSGTDANASAADETPEPTTP